MSKKDAIYLALSILLGAIVGSYIGTVLLNYIRTTQ